MLQLLHAFRHIITAAPHFRKQCQVGSGLLCLPAPEKAFFQIFLQAVSRQDLEQRGLKASPSPPFLIGRMIKSCGAVKLISRIYESQPFQQLPGSLIVRMMACKKSFSIQLPKGIPDRRPAGLCGDPTAPEFRLQMDPQLIGPASVGP